MQAGSTACGSSLGRLPRLDARSDPGNTQWMCRFCLMERPQAEVPHRSLNALQELAHYVLVGALIPCPGYRPGGHSYPVGLGSALGRGHKGS